MRPFLKERYSEMINLFSEVIHTKNVLSNLNICGTVGSKIIQAPVIILATLLYFDCQSNACYKQHKAQRS